MTFLSPLALLWLGGIPILVWLWRYATSRSRHTIPSLAPFTHLLRRPPTRRTRLYTNWLFWLQLICLALIATALAEPVVVGHRATTLLVVVDTSASMAATTGAASPMREAQRALLKRLRSRSLGEEWFVTTTSPAHALTQKPVSDDAHLSRIIQDLSTADLSGNLSMATRLGAALLGRPPDATWVVTDEPVPAGSLDPSVSLHTVGQPLPNAAIIGMEAYEPLCVPAGSFEEGESFPGGTQTQAGTRAQLVVSVQHTAAIPQDVTVVLWHEGRRLMEQTQSLQPRDRAPFSFTLPEGASGLFELRLTAPQDALAVDNRAVVTVRGRDPIRVLLASEDASFIDAIGTWLDACPRMRWQSVLPSALREAGFEARKEEFVGHLVLTDDPVTAQAWPSASMLFARARSQDPAFGRSPGRQLTHWVVESDHPVSRYLEPLVAVPVALSEMSRAISDTPVPWGEPVLWGITGGRKIPLVSVSERGGRRRVWVGLDPAASPSSEPLVVLFFNTLRWLTGSWGVVTTGEPIMVGPFSWGVVRIRRPHGDTDDQSHEGGSLRYEATDQAGQYRFTQGSRTMERVVNFMDPLESNTMERDSTWGARETLPAAARSPDDGPPGRVTHYPLVNWLAAAILALLLLEWLLYTRKGRPGAS